jgi:transcriptional regulator with XRE-family HTH domain
MCHRFVMVNNFYNLATIGATVRQRREKLGLTQERLASLAGLSRATINEIENGQVADLGFAKIVRLLGVINFGVSIAEKGSNIRRDRTPNTGATAIRTAAQTASTSYRALLPADTLTTAIRTGKIPDAFRAHFATLLDEAPIPVVVRAVEAAFRNDVPKTIWRNVAKWSKDLNCTRQVWI